MFAYNCAYDTAMADEVIGTHRPHVHLTILGSTKVFAVESPCTGLIGCVQLVPGAVPNARFVRGKFKTGAPAGILHDW